MEIISFRYKPEIGSELKILYVNDCSNDEEIKNLNCYLEDLESSLDSIKLRNFEQELSTLHPVTSEIPDGSLSNENKSGDMLILGLDCEWRPEKKAETNRTAVIQLSSSKICLVIRVITAKGALPKCLHQFLTRTDIVKVGVDIKADVCRLYRDFSVESCPIADLRSMSKSLTKLETSDGLLKLSKKYLGIEAEKVNSIRCSDWAANEGLSYDQVEYAAWDACLSCNLALTINALIFNELKTDARVNDWLQLQVDFRRYYNKSSEKFMNNTSKMTISTHSKIKKHKVEARKSQLYDNCRMLSPDGSSVISTCSLKKLKWYVDRGLGIIEEQRGDYEGPTLRLLFEPRQSLAGEELYYLSDKINACVVCGNSTDYLRYSIVPVQYRTHLPSVMKDHISHDVVLVCVVCHERCIKAENEMCQKLSAKYNVPMSGLYPKFTENSELKRVIRSCSVLLNNLNQLPEHALRNHINVVEKYFQIHIDFNFAARGELSSEVRVILKRGTSLHCKEENPHWKSHGEQIIDLILKEYTANLGIDCAANINGATELRTTVACLTGFVRMWRSHFVSSINPKYLPEYWDINSRVTNSNFR